VTIKEWWDAKGRALEARNAREAAAAREHGVSAARSLQALADEELIARAPARSSLSHAYHEMEMQRRLKDSIEAQPVESRKARIWAAWGTAGLAVLTVVLIWLTIVLIGKG
jgi:hypothetical protein